MAHRGKKLGLDNRRSQCRISRVSEPVLGRSALGDVAHERDEQLMPAGVERVDRRLERELAAVAPLTDACQTTSTETLRIGLQPFENLRPDLTIAPGDEGLELLADRGPGSPVKALGRAVKIDDRTVGVDSQDGVHTRRHHGALHLFTRLERTLCGLAPGCVAHHDTAAEQLIGTGAENRLGIDIEPAHRAIRENPAASHRVPLACAQNDARGQSGDVLGRAVLSDQAVDDLLERHRGVLLQGEARNLDRLLIAVDGMTILVVDEHALVHGPEQHFGKLGREDRRGASCRRLRGRLLAGRGAGVRPCARHHNQDRTGGGRHRKAWPEIRRGGAGT